MENVDETKAIESEIEAGSMEVAGSVGEAVVSKPSILLSMTDGKKKSRGLRRRLWFTVVALLIAFLLAGVVTYAWYIYNASRHITDVKMAAGTGVTFLISEDYDGPYKANAGMTFDGLLNPVSTDQIRIANGKGGFQEVTGYVDGDPEQGQASVLAYFFGEAPRSDYYKTTLYLTTSSLETDVYLADIMFDDKDDEAPISTCLRMGFVVHTPGQDQAEVSEFIWELTDKHNPNAQYNTYNGTDGDVLDSSKTDGSVVTFTPLKSDNYAVYDEDTGKVTLKANSVKICTLPAAADGAEHGTPVQVDVYVWMEGCDADCTGSVGSSSLDSLAIRFAGLR